MNIHQMKKRRFTRFGAGVFTCQCCKRRTRETNGDHAQTGNCAICFDLAGIENSISDYGIEDAVAGGDTRNARVLLAKLRKLGGDMAIWADLESALDAHDSKTAAA